MATSKYNKGDRFTKDYGDEVEEYEIIEVGHVEDLKGRTKTKSFVYHFRSYRNGEPYGRPIFKMREKYLIDFIERQTWKQIQK